MSDFSGIKVEVMHPSWGGQIEIAKRVRGPDEPKEETHAWISPDGARKEFKIQVDKSKNLSINGKVYGTISQGDHLLIDGDRVLINGTPRSAE